MRQLGPQNRGGPGWSWMRGVHGTESRCHRAIGLAEGLMLKVADPDQGWMEGASGEFALTKLREESIPG